MSTLLLIVVVITFTVFSQVVLKIGQHTFYYPINFGFYELAKMTAINLTNVYVIMCILLTLIAGLCWILVIQNVPLSRAYPIMSLNYVIVYFISWMFFSESLSVPALFGMLLVIAGTCLLGVR